MKSAIFICPFNQETRMTVLPEIQEGQILNWTHIEQEDGDTVKVMIQADDDVLDLMKSDEQYTWVEDIPDDPPELHE